MPKVKGESIFIGGTRYFREFHVGADGVFKSKLPKDVAEALNRSEVTANTLDSCISAWDGAKAEFDALSTTVRKVICYRVEMDVALDGLHRHEIHFTHGIALDLACGVYEERALKKRDGTGAAHYRYEELPSKIPNAFYMDREIAFQSQEYAHLLPWTQEREDWFAGLCAAYEKLIRGLNGLFKDRKALTEGIAKGRLLMGGGA